MGTSTTSTTASTTSTTAISLPLYGEIHSLIRGKREDLHVLCPPCKSAPAELNAVQEKTTCYPSNRARE